MSHTLTASTPITGFTFKAILKELVSSAINNHRVLRPNQQYQKALPNFPQVMPANLLPPSVTASVKTAMTQV